MSGIGSTAFYALRRFKASVDPDHLKSGFFTKRRVGNDDGLDIATFVQETIV
jgi:hypothetical protein